jgi:hypothetical protein
VTVVAEEAIKGANFNYNASRRINKGLEPEMQKLLQTLSTKAYIPGERLKRSLPKGIKVKARVNLSNLSVVYKLTHETLGEIGQIDAVYGGPEMSLSGLYCGINDKDKDEDQIKAIDAAMKEIYETAKTAFTG